MITPTQAFVLTVIVAFGCGLIAGALGMARDTQDTVDDLHARIAALRMAVWHARACLWDDHHPAASVLDAALDAEYRP